MDRNIPGMDLPVFKTDGVTENGLHLKIGTQGIVHQVVDIVCQQVKLVTFFRVPTHQGLLCKYTYRRYPFPPGITDNVKAPGFSTKKKGIVCLGNVGTPVQIGFDFQRKTEISGVLIRQCIHHPQEEGCGYTQDQYPSGPFHRPYFGGAFF